MTNHPYNGARATLTGIFHDAIAAADPAVVVPLCLPPKPAGRCIVIGAGKAAAAMAAALDAAWPDVALHGVVVTPYGHAQPAGRIAVLQAAHPTPDENSRIAAQAMLAAVRNLAPDDLVVALISGGGSALLAAPAGAMSLQDKQAVNRQLLASGASISEINAVRKHLSAIKGGRLAQAAHPARLLTLLISDVPGDDPAIIASGPTVADTSTLADVHDIIARYGIDLPAAARAVLAAGVETPKQVAGETCLIATPMHALLAAAAAASAAGFTPMILGDALQGEAAQLAIAHAGIARSIAAHGQPLAPPCVLLSGGETTVTIGQGPAGQGGRNTEFCLSLAIALQGAPGIHALAGDSDGIDGSSPAAGAFIGPDTLARSRLNPAECLRRHESHGFFDALGDLIYTGPTRTNVNDIRLVLVSKHFFL